LKYLSTKLLSHDDAANSLSLRDAFAARIAPILLTSPVLPSLSVLQRNLDELDIEGLETVSSSFFSGQGSSADLSSLLQPGSEDEWVAFTTSYADGARVAPQDMSSISTSEARRCVLATLLSGTFKDCSLLVSLPDKTIRIADTEPKPPRKLPEWAELDSQPTHTCLQPGVGVAKTPIDHHISVKMLSKDANAIVVTRVLVLTHFRFLWA
jgi:inositol-pentakisphosphate 2-kinase